MRRKSAARAEPAEVEPLDEAEQSALVAELARASAAQARFWRVRTRKQVALPAATQPRSTAPHPLTPRTGLLRLCGVGAGGAVCLGCRVAGAAALAGASFVVRRLFAPLTALPQLVFHADFYGVLPAIAVAAADACGAACVGAASVTLLRAALQPLKPDAQPHAEPPRTAAALAIATSAFWGIAWVRLLRLRATQADAAAASDALKLLWLPMAPLYTLLCEHIERSVQDTDAKVRSLRRCRSAAGWLLTRLNAWPQVAALRGMQYRYKAL